MFLENTFDATLFGIQRLKDSITWDECNLTINTKWGEFGYRNPRCQPPPRPTPPPGNGFYVGDICGCDTNVVFAFYEKDFVLSPGAGIGECLITGEICPTNLREQSLQSGDYARHRFEPHDPNLVIRFKLPYTVNNENIPIGDNITVFFCVFDFTYEEVLENNGYVNPTFPRFQNFRDWGLPTQEAVLDVAPWKVVAVNCIGCKPNEWFDPPPPKKKEECNCMGCCPDVSNQDALLRLILKRIGSLPANVPDNFTKQNPTYLNVESLAELLLWQMQQLDALMGAYPIKIEIEDTDSVQEGNQTQKLELPNQAEVLAELLGLLITVKRDTHATLVTAIKAMGEAGMTKNLATQTLDVVLGNAEFLGYKLEQVKRKIPSLFTPNGANLTETLKEKEVEIISYENTDKKDLQDDLQFLKTMAARWNAQNWRQVPGDPVESLKQTLFGNTDALKETHKENEQGDFNDFTEQCERGFIEVSGITDTVNPWGRPYKERPKIREIGTEKGNYDKDGKERAE